MGDLLLIELRLAGLVEVAGGRAKLLVGEIIQRLVHGDVAGVIQACLDGTLKEKKFLMAGCRPGRHGPGKCRRGRMDPRNG